MTLKKIAEHFNISTAAVSKALNGLPGVSDELRVKIIQYAEENKYTPSIYGRGLRGSHLKIMGVIMADISNPIQSKLIKGIEQKASEYGYSIILCNSNEDWKTEKHLIDVFVRMQIDGVLIVPASPDEEEPERRYESLETAGIPYVCTHRQIQGISCDVVKSDNVFGAKLAVQYLHKKGHSKIIHITPNRNVSSVKERIEGFLEAAEEEKLSVGEKDIFRVDNTDRASVIDCMEKILRERKDFTAIFAFNDDVAFSILVALRKNGKKVPEDVAVIGFDNNDFADACIVPLTTIPQDGYYLGAKAVMLLIDKIEKNVQYHVEELLKPYGVVERESV